MLHSGRRRIEQGGTDWRDDWPEPCCSFSNALVSFGPPLLPYGNRARMITVGAPISGWGRALIRRAWIQLDNLHSIESTEEFELLPRSAVIDFKIIWRRFPRWTTRLVEGH